MNITVNPLEDVEKTAADGEFSDEDDDDEESSDNDSECSFHDEEVSDDEEAHEVRKRREKILKEYSGASSSGRTTIRSRMG